MLETVAALTVGGVGPRREPRAFKGLTHAVDC